MPRKEAEIDYYHYAYQCPYVTGVGNKEIHCEDGCKLVFRTAKSCKGYLRQYCADEDQNWKKCTLAAAKNKFYKEEYDTWKMIDDIKKKNRQQEKERQ